MNSPTSNASLMAAPLSLLKRSQYPLLFIGLLLIVISRVGIAEPAVTEKTIHYQVSGETVEQVRESLDRLSPVSLYGRLFDASTERWVNWQPHVESTPGQRCRIVRVSTKVDIIYTLPELIITDSTPDTLVKKWSRYYAALLRHEKGHGSIAISAARRIESALYRLPTTTSCKKLRSIADRVATQILTTFDYRDQRYDRDTGHGELEGARFPPVNPL